MSSQQAQIAPERALDTVTGRLPATGLLLWLAAVAIGAVGFYMTLGSAPLRAWQAVWYNFVFWTTMHINAGDGANNHEGLITIGNGVW